MGANYVQELVFLAVCALCCSIHWFSSYSLPPHVEVIWDKTGSSTPETAFPLLLYPEGELTDMRGNEIAKEDLKSLISDAPHPSRGCWVKLLVKEGTPSPIIEQFFAIFQRRPILH